VSEGTLREAADQIARRHPGLQVDAVVGDFTLHLAQLPRGGRRMVAFLGGTIGNLYLEERRAFLGALADVLEPGDSLLLGTDLVKSADRLIAAYHDPGGVTAGFVRNSLRVLNRELGADFDLDAFSYVPFWDAHMERMDLRLRSEVPQTVTIPGADVVLDLAVGEEIRVEISGGDLDQVPGQQDRRRTRAGGVRCDPRLDRRSRRSRRFCPDAGHQALKALVDGQF